MRLWLVRLLPELVLVPVRKQCDAGVDAEILVGTGPGGRVIERDVDAFLAGSLDYLLRPERAQQDGLEAPHEGRGLAEWHWHQICASRVQLMVQM